MTIYNILCIALILHYIIRVYIITNCYISMLIIIIQIKLNCKKFN